MSTGFVKYAWVRDPGQPIGTPGTGRISCPCENAPESKCEQGPNVHCPCGVVYSWDGWIKQKAWQDNTLNLLLITGE